MKYTEQELDGVKELINIGIGQASGALNDLLDSHITLKVPSIAIYSIEDLLNGKVEEFSKGDLSMVSLGFDGEFSGIASLIFPKPSASQLVSLLLEQEEEDEADLDSLAIGTVTEVGNIVLNGVMGSISNIFEGTLKYQIPIFSENDFSGLVNRQSNPDSEAILVANAWFKSEDKDIQGNVVIVFELGSFDNLLDAIRKLIES